MSNQSIKIFKSLSDSTRINIVRELISFNELSCHEISQKFDLAQPTLSFHLNKLISAQVISVRKQGSSHIYCVNKDFLTTIGLNIKKIINY
ncbi:MAG: metalloregulator ArsR/SmtB family transcription factor [Candidatus Shapirobacteria bacterium]